MQTFYDNDGRRWDVAVNVASIKRVRSQLDVNLYEVVDREGNLLARLMGDPVLLVDVIYVVCQPQARELGVSDEQFGEAMAGDAIDEATRALLEAIANFLPSPKDRQTLKRALTKVNAALDRGRDLVAQHVDGPEIDRLIDSGLAKLRASFGSLPESSGSTPTP